MRAPEHSAVCIRSMKARFLKSQSWIMTVRPATSRMCAMAVAIAASGPARLKKNSGGRSIAPDVIALLPYKGQSRDGF